MEEKKYSFACVTVRNYNRALDEMLSETFKKTQNQFANSKSQFLNYLIGIGLSVYLKKLNEDDKNPITIESLDEIKELKKLFNEFIHYSKNENERSKVALSVSTLIGSAILGVLTDIAEGKEIDISEIEKGNYDHIPKRFLDALRQGVK